MKKFWIIACIVMIFSGGSVHAQHINSEPNYRDTTGSILGLKVQIPTIKDNENISAFSGIYTFSLTTRLGNDWSLNVELPLVIAEAETGSENGLANIFVSFQKWLDEGKTSRLSAGLYIPTIGEANFLRSSIALYSNIIRIPQVAERTFILYGNYGYSNPAERAGIFDMYAGPDILIPMDEGDTEILAHMGLRGGYKFDYFWAWTELNSVYVLTEEQLYGDSKLEGQLSFAGQFNLGKVNPGLFYTLYFNELIVEFVPGVFGLRLDVKL